MKWTRWTRRMLWTVPLGMLTNPIPAERQPVRWEPRLFAQAGELSCPPTREDVHPFLATPADGHRDEIRVAVVQVFPTRDCRTIDTAVTGPYRITNLDALKREITAKLIKTKYGLEEGSRFRGYADWDAPPAVGYRVVQISSLYEPFVRGLPVPWNPGVFFPDYTPILNFVNARHLVDVQGVRQVWVLGYHYADIEQPESNMSSPTTGDISNSIRAEDLPIYGATYTVYGYNYTRSENENVHNHGHQLEAILAEANRRQDGHTRLFWDAFAGRRPDGTFGTGRAGWTHMPPNTTVHYDYHNPARVPSDIEDWTPDGSGAVKLVDRDTWRSRNYGPPIPIGEEAGHPPAELLRVNGEFNWYVYWMQSMPGRGNRIRDGHAFMSDWWAFTSRWDQSIVQGLGLRTGAPAPDCQVALSAPTAAFAPEGGPGSVRLVTDASCAWQAASYEPWIRIPANLAGSGTSDVPYLVEPNSGHARTGTLSIGGRILTIDQGGSLPCSYGVQLIPSRSPNPHLRRVRVAPSPEACGWSAVSPERWLRVTSGPVGRGNAEVTVVAQPNTGAPRTGAVRIAGELITISQPGTVSDSELVAGVTPVRALHITELRARIDALRARFTLLGYPWTDPAIVPGSTAVRAAHVQDLRAALAEAYTAAGLTPPSYGDAPGAGSVVRAAHLLDLRSALYALEGY